MRRSKVPDNDQFRELWQSGRLTPDIARVFNTTPETVRAAAVRYGLPPRDRTGRVVIKVRVPPLRAVPIADPPPPAQCVSCAPQQTDFWTPARDAQLIASGGRYAALADLADGWGVSTTRVQGRWHLLRVR